MSLLHQADLIAAEVATRLASITVANGSHTDVGLRVLRGRRHIDDSQVPCVVVAEGPDQATAGPGRMPTAEIVQNYVLIAYHACDADNPNDMGHKLLKDLKRAIFKDGVTWLQKVVRVAYRGRDIGPRGDGVGIVCASIEIDVSFVEDLTNP